MSWWWYPLIAFAVLALAAATRLFLTRHSAPVALFLTRHSAPVEMPGGETIFDTPPRREWSAPPRSLD
jgi:hypothetical protein